MTDRFCGIIYDTPRAAISSKMIAAARAMAEVIYSLSDNREKSIALTKLEEAVMWCGKAIKEDQLDNPERT